MDSGDKTSSGRPPAPTLLYAIKQLELIVRSRLDEVLRPRDITVLQYTALTVLRRRGGLTSAELARSSFVTAQTMGQMIATLETRGFVARAQDPANARRRTTSLTQTAHDLLAELDAQVTGLENQMVAGFTRSERAVFTTYLNNCRQSLAGRTP